jgi:tetratricopeptide (TPR) repeat protein
MDSAKQRRAAMQELKTFCDEWASHGQFEISDQALSEYLRSTSEISLSPQERLVFLSGRLGNDWIQLSQLFSYILAHYPSEDPSAVYGIWISQGLEIMSNTDHFNEGHRIHLAEQLERLIREALAHNETGFAFLSGLFYYSHPLRKSDERKYLTQAIHWWEIAIQQKTEDDELDSYSVCHLAHAYFDLGDRAKALEWYKRIDLDQLEEEGRFGRNFARERINACEESI